MYESLIESFAYEKIPVPDYKYKDLLNYERKDEMIDYLIDFYESTGIPKKTLEERNNAVSKYVYFDAFINNFEHFTGTEKLYKQIENNAYFLYLKDNLYTIEKFSKFFAYEKFFIKLNEDDEKKIEDFYSKLKNEPFDENNSILKAMKEKMPVEKVGRYFLKYKIENSKVENEMIDYLIQRNSALGVYLLKRRL
ncbi:MAG: hypothetical protein ACP5IV_07710 [Caldisericia bacterium]